MPLDEALRLLQRAVHPRPGLHRHPRQVDQGVGEFDLVARRPRGGHGPLRALERLQAQEVHRLHGRSAATSARATAARTRRRRRVRRRLPREGVAAPGRQGGDIGVLRRQAHGQCAVVPHGPGQGLARVGHLGAGAGPGRVLVGAAHQVLRAAEQRLDRSRMAAARRRFIARSGKPFQRVVAHGLEQAVARRVVVTHGDQRAVHQGSEAVDHFPARFRLGAAGDRHGQLEREPAMEHAERAEHALLVRRQQPKLQSSAACSVRWRGAAPR